MVLERGIFTTVKGILGYEEENIEPRETQNDIVEDDVIDQKFEDKYDVEVINALENGDYSGAEDLLDSVETEFDEVVQDYIGDKMTTASVDLEYFKNIVTATELLVEDSENEIGNLNDSIRSPEAKLGIKPSVTLASKYISELNSPETTEFMRGTFRSLYQAKDAAEYIQGRDDTELSRYDAESVKELSNQKVEEFKDLDRDIGLDFMVSEFNDIADSYNRL